MATKTMILRPYAVTCDDETLVTLYPSETTMDAAHTLVNEEVADDDSTYILCSTGGSVNYHFNYTKPFDLLKVTSISLCVRHRAETAGSSSTSNNLNNSITILTEFSLPTNAMGTKAGYFDHGMETAHVDILSELNSTTYNNASIVWNRSVPTGNKNNPIRTTQVYIEITYEYRIDDFCIKENDDWVSMSGAIFVKYGDTWTRDVSLLRDGRKYLIRHIE